MRRAFYSSSLRRAEENQEKKDKEGTSGEGDDGGHVTDAETDERYEREGERPKSAPEGPRRKHDTAGPDLEAVEGDIPDSCRRVWIILGPLLARGLQKTAPLIGIKSAGRSETARKKRGLSCRDFLRFARRRFLFPPAEIRRLIRAVR